MIDIEFTVGEDARWRDVGLKMLGLVHTVGTWAATVM